MIDIFGTQIALDSTFALAMAAVFAGGLVRGFAGFGSALVIIPPLTLLFGPQLAVAMEVIIEIPVALMLLPSAVKNAQRRTVIPMLLAIIVTIPIGALALTFVDSGTMKIGISVAVLFMVLLLAVQQKITAVLGTRGAIGAGAASGLIQGATGVGGPPGVLSLLARGDNAVNARANVIAFMNAMVLFSIITFALYGLMTREAIVLGLAASSICLAAVFTGMQLFKRFGDRWLRPVALVFVAITALATLYSTLQTTA